MFFSIKKSKKSQLFLFVIIGIIGSCHQEGESCNDATDCCLSYTAIVDGQQTCFYNAQCNVNNDHKCHFTSSVCLSDETCSPRGCKGQPSIPPFNKCPDNKFYRCVPLIEYKFGRISLPTLPLSCGSNNLVCCQLSNPVPLLEAVPTD